MQTEQTRPTGHTPGPWTCDADETDLFGEYRIHPAYDRGYNGDQDVANARLIAAAPDLLDACQELIWLVELWADAGVAPGNVAYLDTAACVVKARASIAKATGATS